GLTLNRSPFVLVRPVHEIVLRFGEDHDRTSRQVVEGTSAGGKRDHQERNKAQERLDEDSAQSAWNPDALAGPEVADPDSGYPLAERQVTPGADRVIEEQHRARCNDPEDSREFGFGKD